MVTTYKLFTAPTCPNCPAVKAYMLSHSGLAGEVIELSPDRPEGFSAARECKVTSVPQVIFFDECGTEVARASSVAAIEGVIPDKQLVSAS